MPSRKPRASCDPLLVLLLGARGDAGTEALPDLVADAARRARRDEKSSAWSAKRMRESSVQSRSPSTSVSSRTASPTRRAPWNGP